MKKISLLILLTLSLTTANITFADGGTGADPIFDQTGVPKPSTWTQWTHDEKHSFLQDRGIYPARGHKYKGNADIPGYFNFLGIDQPANWYDLTTTERQNFIQNLSVPQTSVETTPEPTLPVSETSTPQPTVEVTPDAVPVPEVIVDTKVQNEKPTNKKTKPAPTEVRNENMDSWIIGILSLIVIVVFGIITFRRK